MFNIYIKCIHKIYNINHLNIIPDIKYQIDFLVNIFFDGINYNNYSIYIKCTCFNIYFVNTCYCRCIQSHYQASQGHLITIKVM